MRSREHDEIEPPEKRGGARFRVRIRVAIGAVLAVLVIAVGWSALTSARTSVGSHPVSPTISASFAMATPAPSAVFVHVVGHVKEPGIYRLGAGARVFDAIAAARGATEDADQSALNLAQRVSDGEQVRVPAVGEAPTPASGSGAPNVGGASAAAGGKINLNSATVEELDTLPRVGPAIAQRIIDYRQQHGRFTSVDQLGDVSGIGDAMLSALRDRVTV